MAAPNTTASRGIRKGAPDKTVAKGCTTIEERPEYAPLPNPHARHYLKEKAKFSLKAPNTTVKLLGDKQVHVSLYQLTCTILIRLEEEGADWMWPYKAEVSYDMSHEVPKPFLSTTRKSEGPNRRHSTNPFPPGYVKGFLRRPDVTIVRNPLDRWAGRATVDHDGAPHVDNLERVVELKFPGDTFGRAQREAYEWIAGGRHRLSVLDVYKCEDDEEDDEDDGNRQPPSGSPTTIPHMPPIVLPPPGPDEVPVPVPGQPLPLPQPKPQPGRPIRPAGNGARRISAPVYSTSPRSDEAWYQRLGREISELNDSIARAVSQLSDELKAKLYAVVPWLKDAGRWVHDAAGEAWSWVDVQGKQVVRWTREQLQTAMEEFRRECDLTWEQLKQVDWGQVLLDVGSMVGVVLMVAGAVVVCIVAVKLLAPVMAFIALVAAGFGAMLTVGRLANA